MHQIVEEIMIMYFDFMKKEYEGFENSALKIEEINIKIECHNCQKISAINEPVFICPFCGSANTEIIAGNELHIASVEGFKTDK
jgi:Zn finger protein HypA/HybF involved in hydrogenase expression